MIRIHQYTAPDIFPGDINVSKESRPGQNSRLGFYFSNRIAAIKTRPKTLHQAPIVQPKPADLKDLKEEQKIKSANLSDLNEEQVYYFKKLFSGLLLNKIIIELNKHRGKQDFDIKMNFKEINITINREEAGNFKLNIQFENHKIEKKEKLISCTYNFGREPCSELIDDSLILMRLLNEAVNELTEKLDLETILPFIKELVIGQEDYIHSIKKEERFFFLQKFIS